MGGCAAERNHEIDEASAPVEELDAIRRRARAEAVWANFTAITATMVLLYAVFTVAHFLFLPPSIKSIMLVASITAILICGATFLYLYHTPVRERWAHSIAGLIMVTILANSALHLYLTGLPNETSNFILLIIGCGIFLYSTPWVIGILSLAVATWCLIAIVHGANSDWFHFGLFVVQVVIISLLAHILRQRSHDQLLRSRLANETQRRELTDTVIALERTQDRLRQISEASFEAVFLHRNGRIVDMNEQAVRLFGYSRDELRGTNITHLLAPEVRSQIPIARKTLHSSTGANRDGRIHESLGLDKQGRRFPVEFGAVQRRPRQDQIDAVAMRDISDRQRLEQRLRDFVENAADYIYETDPLGRFTYVNNAIQAVSFWPGRELIGGDCYTFVYPEMRDRVRFEVEHHDFVRNPTLYQEFRVATGREDVERWLGQNVQPILVRGTLSGYRVLARDITERVMAVREALAARREADEANRSKSRFLSSMSHELRTPLNGILGYAQLLQEEFYGSLNERQRRYVDTITDCSGHLLTLIDDLLDLSKVEIDAVDLKPVTVSAEVAIQSAIAMVRRDASDKEVEFQVSVGRQERMLADPRRIRQILINLLSNAIKFSPRQGEVLVASRRLRDDFIEIVVKDRGPGVAPEFQSRIFSEFFQADHVRDGSLGGSGIGLALVKRLVELHGGSVAYRDRTGGGAVFSVRIPASDNEVESAEAVSEGGNILPGSADSRILVVDDTDANLFLVTEALAARGHVVEVARNGEEAIARAKTFEPALILMDMRMPVMDGFQATRKLKEIPRFKPIPIVALTASVSADAISECLDSGCVEHLGKPIRLKALFDCIDRYLANSSPARPGESSSVSAPPPGDGAAKIPMRVLVADDNATNRDFMAEFFNRLPDEVVFATNGKEAVERALGGAIDLILMDIQMPELDGIEATREIRRHCSAHQLPIVGLSGVEAREEVDACLSAGMNDFISKPVRLARVLEVLEQFRPLQGPGDGAPSGPAQ